MPEITIVMKMDDKATPALRQAATEAERSLARVKDAAAAATKGHRDFTEASERSAVSMRDMKQAIGAIATSFGQVSPTVANVALELSNFSRQMSGASLSSKLFAGGAVAVGGTMAYLMAQFKETERFANRFATINQAIQSLDTGAIRSGIKETRIEIETMARQGTTFIGSVVQSFDNVRRMILGLPPAAVEAQKALTELGRGLDLGVKLESRFAEATHAGELAGLRLTGEQQRVQSLMARGVMGEVGIERAGIRMRDLIDRQMHSALEALEVTWEKEVAGARPDLAGPLLYMNRSEAMRLASQGAFGSDVQAATSRYLRGNVLLQEKGGILHSGLEEFLRQQGEALRGRAEQQRAMGAQLSIERQQALVANLSGRIEASKASQAGNDEWLKSIGVPAWMLPGVDPRSLQLIDEQKRAQVMGIEETLKKSLFAIDQLKLAEVDRARLVGEATAAAELARKTALNEAVARSNELYDSVARIREELLKSGQAVRDGMVKALADAQSRVDALTGTMGRGTDVEAALKTSPGLGSSILYKEGGATLYERQVLGELEKRFDIRVPQSIREEYFKAAIVGDLGKQADIRQAIKNAAEDGTTRLTGIEPSIVPRMQSGGIVPGPRGRSTPIIAHGGEVVLNESQQASLLHGRAGSNPVTIEIRLDGRVIGESTCTTIEKLISVGRLIVQGR